MLNVFNPEDAPEWEQLRLEGSQTVQRDKFGQFVKITPEVIMKLETAFAMDCSVLSACLLANISKSTYYDFIKQFPEWSDRFELLRERLPIAAEAAIAEKIHAKELGAGMWWLKHRRPQRYAPRQEVTGADGAPLVQPPPSTTPEAAAAGYQEVLQNVRPKIEK